jgi:membrane protease YdiL (CAAX protease family)
MNNFWRQLISFIVLLLVILITREYYSCRLIDSGIESYQRHVLLSIAANFILILVSYYFIWKNRLLEIAGLKESKLKKWYLLIFPLVYLVVLNAVFLDELDPELILPNIGLLIIYSISIGLSEELSIRGFLQSHLISRFGETKKGIVLSILIASLFFGLIHLVKYDRGFYGEVSQIFFSTFIGVMFGVLLVATKRLFPLIIIHSIIDFVAKLDSTGQPVRQKIAEVMSEENALLSILLVLPCLIYSITLMIKLETFPVSSAEISKK